MELPDPDEAVEEENLVEEMPLDEGFVDYPADMDDYTVSNVDDAVDVSTSPISATSVTQLPHTSSVPAEPSRSPVSIIMYTAVSPICLSVCLSVSLLGCSMPVLTFMHRHFVDSDGELVVVVCCTDLCRT